ncbi:hypothetical protein B566_EDAN003777 [Ephemera danica]|nr:hypothetical protein B566_EDAN003777 [Ephemera danica]
MGERKGTNKYYPPDYNPNKGGLNKFLGTHALRERARKLHMGILIIRFEMPYNIWCDGCKNHIGMGVRYNAEKTKVGMYYTTPVYQFRMKCHLCDNHIEMKTDPGNLDYVIVSGARRQENRWDPLQNEQVVPEEKATSRRMADDAMFKLEHGEGDKSKAQDQAPRLQQLAGLREERWKDDYAANSALRATFRAQRQQLSLQTEQDKQLLARTSLSITLLPEAPEDTHMASLLTLAPAQSMSERFSKAVERIDQRPVLPGALDIKPAFVKQLQSKAAESTLSREKLGILVAGSSKTVKKEVQEQPEVAPKRLCLVSGDYGTSSSGED